MYMVFTPEFREVTRAQAKASVVIGGLAGKGKSGLALSMAYVLADEDWSSVCALDTENKSLSLFEGIPSHLGVPFGKFLWYNLQRTHGYRPTHYLAAKEAAIARGAKAFVQDSITHAWTGPGGILQLVNEKEASTRGLNNFSAWGEPEVAHEKNSMYEMIRDLSIHIICTVRMKEKHVQKDSKILSLGEQQIQMPDLKYEPDLVLEMVEAGNTRGKAPKAIVRKSRYAIFDEGETYTFNLNTLMQLKEYLAEGADPSVMMEQQRQEFIAEVKSILDSSESKRTVYSVIKDEYGLKDTPLTDFTLEDVRKVLGRLLV